MRVIFFEVNKWVYCFCTRFRLTLLKFEPVKKYKPTSNNLYLLKYKTVN